MANWKLKISPFPAWAELGPSQSRLVKSLIINAFFMMHLWSLWRSAINNCWMITNISKTRYQNVSMLLRKGKMSQLICYFLAYAIIPYFCLVSKGHPVSLKFDVHLPAPWLYSSNSILYLWYWPPVFLLLVLWSIFFQQMIIVG